MTTRLLSPLLALAVAAAPAVACIHLPAGYEGSPAQTAQEAIVFWAAGREILVLKNDFRLDPAGGSAPPARLAWVVPVPNEPDGYGVEDPAIFQAMFQAWTANQPREREDGLRGEKSAPAGGIELLEKAEVGEYAIQPIRARGVEGGRALNAWLAEHGFGELAPDRMAWYLERRWVWLAVEVDLASAGSDALRGASLRPLRIDFASDEIVVPLLFSAGQGAFDVNLYLVTERRIARLGTRIAPYGFRLEGQAVEIRLPGPAQAVQEQLAAEGRWKVLERPVVDRLVGQDVGTALATWTDDFRIDPEPARRPPDWPAIAIGTAIVLAAAGLLVRRLRSRR